MSLDGIAQELKREQERAWAKALIDTHQKICWERKITLSPVTISFTDAKTSWAVWHPRDRHISFQRCLLLERPWSAVEGVLRHEMAHQWVDEHLAPTAAAEGPHGACFLKACERLGVPPTFRGAVVDAAVMGKDTEALPSAELEILRKVQKLMALADSTNPHEAAQALEKAKSLLADARLETWKDRLSVGVVSLQIPLGVQRVSAFSRQITSLLMEELGVGVVSTQSFSSRGLIWEQALEVFGKKAQILLFEWAFHHIHRSLERSWGQWKRQQGAEGRNSFALGFAEGIRESLKSRPWAAAAEKSTVVQVPEFDPSQALIPAEMTRAIESAIGERFPRLRTLRHSVAVTHEGVYGAGQSEGRKVKWGTPLETGGRTAAVPLLPSGRS